MCVFFSSLSFTFPAIPATFSIFSICPSIMARSVWSSRSTASTLTLPSSTFPTMPIILLVPISRAKTTSFACSFITVFSFTIIFDCTAACVFFPLAIIYPSIICIISRLAFLPALFL